MHDSPMPHWSWSVPRAPRKRRRPANERISASPASTHGGWLRPAAPAKCAPTVFIGAPIARRDDSTGR